MLGLAAVTFFSATGLMLNHEDWFGFQEPAVTTRTGNLPADQIRDPDKLAVVESLRRNFAATGALDSFETADDQLTVVFKSPGRRSEAVIHRPDGATEVTHESHGLAGRLVELHRGTDAGTAWKRVIDATAILLLLISLSGLALWSFVPRWRARGLAAVILCLAACATVYFTCVP